MKSVMFIFVPDCMVNKIDKNTIKVSKSQQDDLYDTGRLVRYHKRHVTLIAATLFFAPGESPGARKCQVPRLIYLVVW